MTARAVPAPAPQPRTVAVILACPRCVRAARKCAWTVTVHQDPPRFRGGINMPALYWLSIGCTAHGKIVARLDLDSVQASELVAWTFDKATAGGPDYAEGSRDGC